MLRKQQPKITISEEGEQLVEALEKERKKELEKLEKEHKITLEAIAGKSKTPEHRSRLKFWGKTKVDQVDDAKYWALVNVEALKEFVKYGANKVMDQIRIRTHANIMAREEIQRLKDEKKGMDARTVLYTLLMAAIIGSVAFVVITQFLNYKTVEDENMQLKRDIGSAQGSLAACQTELATYKPGTPEPPKVTPGQPDNVMEG